MNEKTWEFIRNHANDDVRHLALRGANDADVDLALALQQIAGWQTARQKLPSWAETEGIIYPPRLNMEQCSSEKAARYKAEIVQRLNIEKNSFVDLTGGFGVDFYFISQLFRQRLYVELNESLCAISTKNFELLNHDVQVFCGSAADVLATLSHADLIFLDPARRNKHGGRTYSIEDCTPNVLELLPLLLQKTDCVLLKLSPMLDWHQAAVSLKHVREIHIVSIDNECKELLLLLKKETAPTLRLVCANNDSRFEAIYNMEARCFFNQNMPFNREEEKQPRFLYEPNASLMKAGCFDLLTARYPVRQIAENSHLFLSHENVIEFPGRSFLILAISSANRKELNKKVSQFIFSDSNGEFPTELTFSESLIPLERANISIRNFPMTAEQLRKKLKLKDGGDVYIFATTMRDGSHRLFICRKIR